MKHIWLWIIGLWLVCCFILSGCSDEPYKDEHVMATHALQKTNIIQDFVPDFVFHGSHIGRDMYSQTFFEFSYTDRKELMDIIRNTDGWHVETLTSEDYCDFVEITWYPSMVKQMICGDIEFDAWFYRETTPSAGYEPMIGGYFSFLGRAARGFEFAVFDKETGLFIFIDQFG